MADRKVQFFNGGGYGKYALEKYGYNQAVRVGDRIGISGQGKQGRVDVGRVGLMRWPSAWDPTSSPPSFPYPTDLEKQIEQVFKNIDFVLKEAGGKGISQVYRLNSYHPSLERVALSYVRQNLERWFPDDRPIWTAVGVEKLAFPEMLVEIEAVAFDPVS